MVRRRGEAAGADGGAEVGADGIPAGGEAPAPRGRSRRRTPRDGRDAPVAGWPAAPAAPAGATTSAVAPETGSATGEPGPLQTAPESEPPVAADGSAGEAAGVLPAEGSEPSNLGVAVEAQEESSGVEQAAAGGPEVPASPSPPAEPLAEADLSAAARADRALAEVADALRRMEEVGEEPAEALRETAAAALPEAPTAETLSLEEACAELAVTDRLLRRLLADFGDLLPPAAERGEEPRLARGAVVLLGEILRWRREGLSDLSIRRQAEARAAIPPALAGSEVGAPAPVGQILAHVSRLHEEIARQEERRAEDRDRLLTALMRTNQELQHLRLEISQRSRRERRRGFLARFFR